MENDSGGIHDSGGLQMEPTVVGLTKNDSHGLQMESNSNGL